jgi:hypothetical protein
MSPLEADYLIQDQASTAAGGMYWAKGVIIERQARNDILIDKVLLLYC